MSAAELSELLLDPRLAIAAIVVRNGTVASSSDAARELFASEVGKPIEALFDAASRAKLAVAMTGAPASCEVQALPGGEPVVVRVAVLPVGPDVRLLIVSRIGAEYSERMAQQLLAANDRLANLTRELSRQSAELDAARTRFESLADLREHFVSMLAHDVRGALQGIVLGAEVATQAVANGASEPSLAALGRIRRGATRITDLVEKVLEAARTETGQMVLDARPTSLRAVAQDAIDVYTPVAERAGIRLELVELEGPLDGATVSGDQVRLGQVVGNLIENAIRHSPARSAVTLELSATPDLVRLAVRDQGPGIPAKLRDRLFDRFVRGPGARGSLGLGLYVARQLVELHAGRIHIEDVAPHGAAFVIELPRAR